MSRRFLTMFALLAAASLALSSTAGAVSAGASRSHARVVTCHTASAAAARYVVFQASMTALNPGDKLEIEFDLQQRNPGDPGFARVDAPGLGVFIPASGGVNQYRYTKRVENLAAPARYRALVMFRWTAPDGTVEAVDQRLTGVCRQPARALRPGSNRG